MELKTFAEKSCAINKMAQDDAVNELQFIYSNLLQTMYSRSTSYYKLQRQFSKCVAEYVRDQRISSTNVEYLMTTCPRAQSGRAYADSHPFLNRAFYNTAVKKLELKNSHW